MMPHLISIIKADSTHQDGGLPGPGAQGEGPRAHSPSKSTQRHRAVALIEDSVFPVAGRGTAMGTGQGDWSRDRAKGTGNGDWPWGRVRGTGLGDRPGERPWGWVMETEKGRD